MYNKQKSGKCNEEKWMVRGLGMGHGGSLFKMKRLETASQRRGHLCKDWMVRRKGDVVLLDKGILASG